MLQANSTNSTSEDSKEPVDPDFNTKIFWEETMPNKNVTEYTMFFVSTD